MTADAFSESIFDLAFLSGFKEGFPDLCKLAEDEDWGYTNTASSLTNPILTNYIQYTYKRLVSERKISASDDAQKLTFNTGLVTQNQEEIFALFNVNRIPNKQPWVLEGWFKKSARELAGFGKLPEIAQYYDDPSVLVFDPRKEIRANIDHIIDDNKERFPEPYKTMENFALINFFEGALSSVKERVKRNYKTAIPQYFNGHMQILLPICLSNPRVADVALAVELFGENYRASTILTLDMAYNNARQLARPERDWLQP